MKFDKREIWKAKDELVKKHGFNAYRQRGFDEGVKFAQEQIDKGQTLPIASVDSRRELLPVKYDIDFGGHFKAGIEIIDNKPKIVGAINGWGHDIDIETTTISEIRQ
tara:strand:+ start:183 stop:503 length:321 start_codon:yes stop_codon:yes gene_type:complete